MRTWVGVAVAGIFGALARYWLDGVVSRRTGGAFPWGTFVVNISGAFVLGFLFTVLTERFRVSPWLRTSLTVGLLGAYTTFSTLSLETFRLIEDGAVWLAAANGLGSLAAGLVAVYLGVVLGRVV